MRYVPNVILSVLLGVCAQAGGGEYEPHTVIHDSLKPYMSEGDPLALDMKARSLVSDPYKFWRGSKDLFFAWCRRHSADWLADRSNYVASHGDLHMGNIGTYTAGTWGGLAFGMVDFDDSAELPFQLELLQGVITLQLAADQNGIALTPVQRQEVTNAMVDAYRDGLLAGQAPVLQLNDLPAVGKLLARKSAVDYSRQLEQMTDGSRFRPVIRTGKGKVKEILRPVEQKGEFAAAVAEALENDATTAALFRLQTREALEPAIRDVALRTRVGSSGSQGLKKYLVLIERPLLAYEGDVIVYLKQQIPAAAERSDAIRSSDLPSGQRCYEHMNRMLAKRPLIHSWCSIGGESYWVSFKEPWSDELDAEELRSVADLQTAATIWGTVAGAAHGGQAATSHIASRLTPQLRDELASRAAAYMEQLRSDFAAYTSDERTLRAVERAEAVLREAGQRSEGHSNLNEETVDD